MAPRSRPSEDRETSALAAGAQRACQSAQAMTANIAPEAAPVEYKTQPATRGRVTTTVTASGTLSPLKTVQVGSQMQRVAIARAIVTQPKLILADEPTGNLDTRTSDEVHDLLFRINDEHKMTLLVVTHNMDLAWKVPRRIRMEDGQLVDDVRHDPSAAREPPPAGTSRSS